MCIYIRTMPLCGHPPPTLLSYASCGAVLAQLLRIAEPDAWTTPEARGRAPFALPDDCGPREGGNVWTLYSDDYCGWECRNNAYLVREVLAAAATTSVHDDHCDYEYDYKSGGGVLPAYYYVPGDQGGTSRSRSSRSRAAGGYYCAGGRGL